MAEEQNPAEYNDLVRDFTNATKQSEASAKRGKDTVDTLKFAIRDLGRVGKTAFTGILDVNGSFSSMNNSVTSAGNMLRRLTGSNYKTTTALSLVITGIEKTIKSLFGFNDSMIKFYDGLGEYGITVGHSSDQLLKLAHSAGYYLEKSEAFSKLLTETGDSLLALAPTASEGADKLALIFNNTQGKTQEEFLKLGIGPEQLNKMQLDYIKLQSGYGAKLSGNADQIRERSVQYALSINKLSMLTGARREAVAQTLAAANADTKFALKKRMLEQEGNLQAIDAFDQTGTLLNITLGEKHAAAFRDLAANHTATTLEGKALLSKTGGRIVGWVRQLEAGQLTGIDVAKLIAKTESEYVRTNQEAVSASEDFRNNMFLNGKSMTADAILSQIKTEKDVEEMIKKRQAGIDDAKRLQNSQLNTERTVNIALDRLKLAVSGPANSVFIWLIKKMTQLATGVLKLALQLPIGETLKENLEEFRKILGGDVEIQQQLDDINKEVSRTSEETEVYARISGNLVAAEKEKALAEQQNILLTKRIQAGETIDPNILRENELNLTKKRAEVAEIKKREADLLKGRTVVQLEAEKKEAEARRERYRETLRPHEVTAYEERRVQEAKQQANNYSGLNIKGAESIAGGPVDPKLIELARRIQAAIPGVKFTAFNDLTHKRGKHVTGTALDFTMDPPPKNAEEAKLIKKKLYDLGFSTALDEYFTERSPGATGPHFHAAFAEGGVATGSKSGYEVTLHGTEAIIPLLPNNTVPIKLKNKDKLSDFSSITNSIKSKLADVMANQINSAAGNDALTELLVNMIRGKFVAMISQVEMSNSVQSELKMYLRN
jgi:hypothetical protein